MLEIRVMNASEMGRIRDIDRAENIHVGYRQEGTELTKMDVQWDDHGWLDGDGEHSFGGMIQGAERCMELGSTAFGAFDGDRLAGIAIYRPRLSETMAQLALLHVSNAFRRQGLAARLFERVLDLARQDGASEMYVSATPTGSAVGFYQSRGFVPTSTPNPELLAEEPEDIHMVLRI